MHKQQRQFCEGVRARFPSHFKGKRVLDCGSLDINGNNRYLFADCEYTGIDIGDGPNVDVVCPIHLYRNGGVFDTIISTECFEHDADYDKSLGQIFDLLSPGGLFLFTCATHGRAEHGTKKSAPADSPFTGDYYKNLGISDISMASAFKSYAFEVNGDHKDLYFWGIK
jgi:SAM-dependent methyltransferase